MSHVLVKRDDRGIVTATLNRPEKKNAIDAAMWQELIDLFDEVAASRDDRVLVVTGAGDAFTSGADLTGSGASDMTQGVGAAMHAMRLVGRCALRLHELPKPTIAAVNGIAVGAGCNLALGCDLIVASDTARFSEIFVRRGLSIDFGGSWLLPRLVGLHKAKELALFADVISAQEAERLGIVNRVVPAAELDKFVDDWAGRLAAMPPLALSMSKTMLNNSSAVSFSQAVEDEARSQTVNFGTADMAEAMAAFVEKRDPRFQGR